LRSKNRPGRIVNAFDPLWAEPDESLLEDRRGELPEFPIEVFPPLLSN
jgi:hypothetical protein